MAVRRGPITVCDKCGSAACWQGTLMCEEAIGAGTLDEPGVILDDALKQRIDDALADWDEKPFGWTTWGAMAVLLQEILSRFPTDVRTGAQLLGVSPPTFRRRARQMQTHY